jgi:hypothetical protein
MGLRAYAPSSTCLLQMTAQQTPATVAAPDLAATMSLDGTIAFDGEHSCAAAEPGSLRHERTRPGATVRTIRFASIRASRRLARLLDSDDQRQRAEAAGAGEDSLGERVQRTLPDAKVVKAFNTIGNPYFVDPAFSEGPPTMLIAGNDDDAKRTVGVLADFGWPPPVDIGGIEGSRELEAICIAWVRIGGARGSWDHGFKLLVG